MPVTPISSIVSQHVNTNASGGVEPRGILPPQNTTAGFVGRVRQLYGNLTTAMRPAVLWRNPFTVPTAAGIATATTNLLMGAKAYAADGAQDEPSLLGGFAIIAGVCAAIYLFSKDLQNDRVARANFDEWPIENPVFRGGKFKRLPWFINNRLHPALKKYRNQGVILAAGLSPKNSIINNCEILIRYRRGTSQEVIQSFEADVRRALSREGMINMRIFSWPADPR